MLSDAALLAALPRLYRLARLWRASEPEDLVQMTCERALRFRAGFRDGSVDAWLATMMRRLLVNEYRSASRRPNGRVISEADVVLHAPQEAAVLLREVGEIIERTPMMRVLPMAVRGDSYEEMAAATGWAEAGVRSRLHRARVALRGLCVVLMIGAEPAVAHPDDEWLRSLTAPDGSSCCSERDCFPSDARLHDGLWKVPNGSGWEAVPPERVLRQPNKDGRPILCRLPSGVIVCFLPPPAA